MAPCHDLRPECGAWAAAAQCASNPAYMHEQCALSCGACGKGAVPAQQPVRVRPKQMYCSDVEGQDCKARAVRGECHASRNATAMLCPVSCNLCRFRELLREALACEDLHENCARWAAAGECRANPSFMHSSCSASCQICAQKRAMCDRPPDTPPTVVAGTIDATMRRILSDFPQYSPRALSQPTDEAPRGRGSTRPPWVVTLKGFLN
eukprot:6913533-Prymnesium_polylepis.1